MVNQITAPSKQTLTIPNNFSELTTSLQTLKPNNSETTQIITYALVGTVIAGLLVYQYIKQNESN